MSLTTSSEACTSCGDDLAQQRREFSRNGEPLCLPCYRGRVKAHAARRRRGRFWQRLKPAALYTLVVLALPPVVYLLVHVLQLRQAMSAN